MEISFHSHLHSNIPIATKFFTWHDSCAVVACAKICCDLMASNRVMARRSSHQIWIAGKKNVSETGPRPWNQSRLQSSDSSLTHSISQPPMHLCFARAIELIDQSHRYGRHQAAGREPAGSYDKTTRTAICFEHKTQYPLIRAPYTRIVIFWHISNIPPMISQSQISCDTPTFYIAAIFVKYCYTTGIWLL